MSRILKWVDSGDRIVARALPSDPVRFVGMDPATARVALWMEHSPINEWAPERKVERTFQIVGTGDECGGLYVGSVIAAPYVWHVYEVTRLAGVRSA